MAIMRLLDTAMQARQIPLLDLVHLSEEIQSNVVAGSSKLNIEMTSTNSVLIWLLVLRNDLGFGLPKP